MSPYELLCSNNTTFTVNKTVTRVVASVGGRGTDLDAVPLRSRMFSEMNRKHRDR